MDGVSICIAFVGPNANRKSREGRSINIDYKTGAQGTGEAGKMLKMLSRDRRVDKGTKWSPIFGRYSFLHPDSEGHEIEVGDEVVVSRQNTEHTAFGRS